MPPERSQGTPDEETPLLHDGNAPRKETPLPVTQIVVLLLLQLAEPITSLSINPYINQLISELPVIGGDERKVGYYAGFIVSLYFAAEAVTVLQWSRLSDYVGRKPVLLCGLLGTIVASILFGLSRSFTALVFSRCLHGMLNGNIGVMKSMMAELTDETNMARGFSLIPVTWAVGGTIGPFIGGVLSRPQDHWPNVFSHPFWGEYPYFLPCLATAAYSLLSFILAAIFLKEVGALLTRSPRLWIATPSCSPPLREILDGPAMKDTEKPVPLRALLTRPVVVSVANYGMIGLFEMTAGVLIPLIWSTSVEFGGLGMSPASIGLWMAGYGVMNGIFQFIAFPRNLALRHSSHGTSAVAGLLIILQLSAIALSDMGFSAVFMYISSAAPNKRSLGATNGIAQTIVSIQRTVGPATAASLFAFSLDNNILGGNFAYVVLHAVVWLPRNTWKHK
ncbi:MFS general substrate transporter [Lactarius akahatsu]|uniref:MFS general substrate transporter n=1 Tax=Lactarius akahatsu TaxID=416441 RepID=A0AAD4L4B7_9AGAM|nr:MFS general substrate transporter [Lactarius akahatsu]